MERNAPELVFGTVQLGLPYGIANRTGMPDAKSAEALVQQANASGVRTFDTARAYGESEARLSGAFRSHDAPPTLLTKLAPLDDLRDDADRKRVEHAVNNSIQKSIAALGTMPFGRRAIAPGTSPDRVGTGLSGRAWKNCGTMRSSVVLARPFKHRTRR